MFVASVRDAIVQSVVGSQAGEEAGRRLSVIQPRPVEPRPSQDRWNNADSSLEVERRRLQVDQEPILPARRIFRRLSRAVYYELRRRPRDEIC